MSFRSQSAISFPKLSFFASFRSGYGFRTNTATGEVAVFCLIFWQLLRYAADGVTVVPTIAAGRVDVTGIEIEVECATTGIDRTRPIAAVAACTA